MKKYLACFKHAKQKKKSMSVEHNCRNRITSYPIDAVTFQKYSLI